LAAASFFISIIDRANLIILRLASYDVVVIAIVFFDFLLKQAINIFTYIIITLVDGEVFVS